MRIIVTGGLGFLGSNLCKFLVKKGEEVICMDHFGANDPRNLQLSRELGITVIKQDINQQVQFKGPIDQIYHLASRASPINYQQYPVETALTGAIGTKNMLDLAMEKNARLLFSSTSEVYGDPLECPQRELYWGNVNPIGVRSCYDESKRFGEALLMAYLRQHKTDIKIVRIFNSYGPGMRVDDGRVMSNFINQAIRNQPITIYGKGNQSRSFCYVDDTIEGTFKMMNFDGFVGPVNIGNPSEISVLELAKTVISETRSKSKLIFMKIPQDDPFKRIPDISLARSLLGFEPKINLAEGMRRTIAYYRQIMKKK